MNTKICTKCGYEKLLKEFHKHSRAKDGLQCCCKKCRKKNAAIYHKNTYTPIDKNEKKLLINSIVTKVLNKTFGNLFVKKYVGRDKSGNALFVCDCLCGNEKIIRGSNLIAKIPTRSCGCLCKKAVSKALKGKKLTKEHLLKLHNSSLKGSDSPHWNPNLKDEERIIRRHLPENSIWIKSIFERDNYKCQCCGQVGAELEAHHMENYADNPELRYDVDNGITLCKECHRTGSDSFHKKYGYKNTNFLQTKEFIINRNLNS